MVSDRALIFHIYWVKPFLEYHSQGHLSRSMSIIKVVVFRKMAIAGGFNVSQTQLVSSIFIKETLSKIM